MNQKYFSVFVYNGEIWVSDLSGLKEDTEKLREMIKESESYINKPAVRYRVALDVFDTRFDKETAFLLADSIQRTQKNIVKLGIKGMSFKGKLNFKRKLASLKVKLLIKYFKDWELCKQWLVSESV